MTDPASHHPGAGGEVALKGGTFIGPARGFVRIGFLKLGHHHFAIRQDGQERQQGRDRRLVFLGGRLDQRLLLQDAVFRQREGAIGIRVRRGMLRESALQDRMIARTHLVRSPHRQSQRESGESQGESRFVRAVNHQRAFASAVRWRR